MINSNVYIRHILPYEKALLIFIVVLYLYLRNKEYSRLRYFSIGFLSSVSFSIYPGYYFIPVFIGIYVFIDEMIANRNFSQFIKKGFTILLGFISLLVVLELISRFGENHYIDSCLTLSETIKQGSLNESLFFPLKYLFEVEGISGVLIICSILIVLTICIIRIIKGIFISSISREPVLILILISLTGMLLHGVMGTVFHKMVFYGRLMHLYLPFLVMAIVYTIHLLNNNRTLSLAITLIILINFSVSAVNYFKLGYPKSMLYKYKIDNRKFSQQHFYNETDSILYPLFSPNELNNQTNYPYTNDTNFLLINCALITPITDPNDYKKFIPSKELTLITSLPYYFTFPAYAFEGLTDIERKHVKERKYKVQFYKTPTIN